ncbi:MAG TPA: preprotein translocase subunit SecG [Gammaproteobacteria bacterium]|nr:preprotein translocase subunit SecG [Gammaproteobacteria bacterium]
MLQSIVLVVHIAIAVLIIGLVLLQRGKGAEAGTGFGAGASGTVFGARGSASFLSRATAALATLFFITSLGLAYLVNQHRAPQSLLERVPAHTQQTQLPPAQAPNSEPPGAPTSSAGRAPAGGSAAGVGNEAPAGSETPAAGDAGDGNGAPAGKSATSGKAGASGSKAPAKGPPKPAK